jgi:hypothetical protein
MSELLTEASEDDLEELASDIIGSIEHITLTVDELAVISMDLQLPSLLDGGVEFDLGVVDAEAARRSLMSKGCVVTTDAGMQLAPWLTMMADVASDPFAIVRMKRTRPDVDYEWTLFVNQYLGVQQQSSDDGLVAWAPFEVGDLFEIIVEAMGIDDRVVQGEPISFTTAAAVLEALDQASLEDSFGASSAGIPAGYLADLKSGGSTSLMTIVDRTNEPPHITDVVWAELGDRYWELRFPETPGADVQVTSQSGKALAEQILRALSIDPAEVFTGTP